MKKIFFLFVCGLLIMSASSQSLMLYGGRDHDVFLGCINCHKYDTESIWNKHSTYGNKYSSYSIWNDFSQYGDKYSTTSPWNKFASYPPAIVDKNGKFYGYLTVNQYKSQRANFRLANLICENHTDIRENLDEWYKKLFY